eukprot:TRINITY_DN28168_c0_g1_i1.p1 TRINITY_DN28168_c0_g1~~TRINITY_DN28168_c0_g1_i1.p1  ORF type:complete len:246 (+),score=67.00 TRINITY_DN28168_c0_g1_i1:75-740(+)
MAEWLDDAAKEEEPQSKRPAVGATGRDQLTLLIDSTKQTLANAQAIRLLNAAVFGSYMVPSKLKAVMKAQEATTAFVDQTRGKSGHKLGSPHLQAWRASLVGLMENNQTCEVQTTEVKVLEELLGGTLTPKSVSGMVKMFKLKECFDEEYTTLLVSIYPEATVLGVAHKGSVVQAALHKVLVQSLKATAHEGQAPPTRLERKLQTQLKQYETKEESQTRRR